MEQIVIGKPICGTCGVDVRPNSMFCYNCGGDVSSSVPADGREVLIAPVEDGAAKTSKLEMPPVKEDSEKKEVGKFEDAEKNAGKIEQKSIEEPKLKSAASMRRQSKTLQRKNVEVVWEQPESDSLPRLALVTLLLVIFAAVIIYLAVYNK